MEIVIIAAVLGAIWRRWLGSDRITGRRWLKVTIGFAVFSALLLADGQRPLWAGSLAAAMMAMILPPMRWLDPVWTVCRWALPAIPAAAIGVFLSGPAALIIIPASVLAGLSWWIFSHWNGWPRLRIGRVSILDGYTSYAEMASGGIVWAAIIATI